MQVVLFGQEHPDLTSLSFGYPFEKEEYVVRKKELESTLEFSIRSEIGRASLTYRVRASGM